MLILHIGAPKTGSTAIQNSLQRNAKQLMDQGVLANYRNYDLTYCYSKESFFPSGIRVRHDTPEAARRWSEDNWLEFEDKIRQRKPKLTIISSEFLLSATDPEKVFDRVSRHFKDIHSIAYMRDAVSFFPSHIDQAIRRGKPTKSFNVKEIARRDFQMEGLAKYIEVFGADNMTIRNFDRSNLVNNDVLDDFMHVVETVSGEKLSLPKRDPRTNSSMCGAASAWMLRRNDQNSDILNSTVNVEIRTRWQLNERLRSAPDLAELPKLKLPDGPLKDSILCWSTKRARWLNKLFFQEQVGFPTKKKGMTPLSPAEANAAFQAWVDSYLTDEHSALIDRLSQS